MSPKKNSKPKRRPLSNRLYPTYPRVGVGVVVWRDGKILIIKRGTPPLQGEWGLPGGVQELGETLFQAAEREVFEETGLHIANLGFITALDKIVPDQHGKIQYHYSLIELHAVSQSGTARAGDDALDVMWIDPQDVSTHCAWPAVEHVVRLSMLQIMS